MKLDARLEAVRAFVPAGGTVADIGTDHGYLAAALVQSGQAERVIASDLNLGPCEAARRTVREANLRESIEVRQGDGLTVLAPGEAQTVCIAGMGGALMTDILAAAPLVMKKLQTLVLQPMNGAYELRHYLYTHSWHVADEALVVADDRIYTVIRAEKGRRKMPDALTLEIGPVLWERKPELLRHHIESLLFGARRAVAGMEKSERAKKSAKYKEAQKRIKALEERLVW
ncbi:class I SAM-dependent methyltransferase [uncultured Selenomonas sp.]|uniref:tRNA (adenine(22)-N(1))-methyltransferase n=1 Tax=uncultured Selenomonas sp. TaxID=159275 RepID=UPI0025D7704B|nr:class I SAM-dependent methyltransferase [uncultured Selenomonas sp.]